MKKIAVIGVGAIGGLLGSYLTRGGYDVTIISCFRRENAEYMAEHGIDVDGVKGAFHVDVKSVFLDDLTTEQKFDCFLVALKGNDTQAVLERLKDNLMPEGCCLTMQNGMNEDLIAEILGPERVLYAVSRAGGQMVGPGKLWDHDGEFVIGEGDNSATPRILELREILSCVRPTRIAEDIIAVKWDKLCAVALSVPVCTVSGIYLSDVFFEQKAQQLFGLLAREIFAVAEASGHPLPQVLDRTEEEWAAIAAGTINGALDRADPKIHFPPGVVDAYTMDIRKGRPLEIDYTNGAVTRLGRRCGVATPVNDLLVERVLDIAAGKVEAGVALLDEIIAQGMKC